jgi:ComF family protein
MNCTNIFFDGLVHLLYPQVCAGCGSDLVSKDQLICLECFNSLPATNFWNKPGNPVEKIFWGRLPVVAAASFMYFTKQSVIQNLLHQLKYKGNKEVGTYFGKLMGTCLHSCERFNDVDALIPLPLFYQKERKRGYNQASCICEGISETLGKPVLGNVIERKRKTDTQTRKSRLERWKNIDGKFELTGRDMIGNRHVLLVDDVITTGATLEACGAELLKGENVRLSIVSLAYTTL